MTIALALLALAFLALLVAAAVLGRRASAALDDARAHAARADQAREAFFDLTTHELRSPLAAILGYQELLADGAYGEMQPAATEPIARLGRAAQHLLHLIDGVVELSRLRVGALEPDAEPVHLANLVAGIADAFRTHASDRGIEPRVDIQPKLPIITSDPDRLVRALDLLITSALKNPAGDYIGFEAGSHGDDLEIRIQPIRLLVHDASDDPAVRLGIRLAVAGGIARLLGGDLDLDSDDDGATIRALRFRVRDLAPAVEGRAGP